MVAGRSTAANSRAAQGRARRIKIAGQIITFIDELHRRRGGATGDSAMDAGNMIKPMLAAASCGWSAPPPSTSTAEVDIEDAALERRFRQVFVGEPSVEDTVGILRGLKDRYEAHHGVRITDSLWSPAVLSDRYITSRFLPDKAIDLVDEAASRLRMGDRFAPVEVDEAERLVRRHEIEEMALEKKRTLPPGSAGEAACRSSPTRRRSWRS